MSGRSSADEIADLLKKKYGDRYQIVTQFPYASIAGLNADPRPDIVLFDELTRKLMIVEIKGVSPEHDLPVGVVSVVKKVQEANVELSPKMVLVSPSNVSGMVESVLTNENIDLIKDRGLDTTFSKITELWDSYLSDQNESK